MLCDYYKREMLTSFNSFFLCLALSLMPGWAASGTADARVSADSSSPFLDFLALGAFLRLLQVGVRP